MTTEISNKIKTISFLLIVMVVFLHSYNLDTKGLVVTQSKNFNWLLQHFISFGLTRIAVPLFFIISGFLFVYDAKVSLSDLFIKIKKRVFTVFMPFITWSLIGILFYFILQQIPQTQSFFTNKLITNYTFSDFVTTLIYKPIPYQLWFLRDLFVLIILSPIILYVIKKIKLIFISVILIFWFLNHDTVFLTPEALLFFVLGIIISQDYKLVLEKRTTSLRLPIIWLLLVIAQLVLLYFNNKNAATIVLKTSILIGVPSFWVVYDLIINQYNFEKITNNITWTTFFIFVVHEPFLTFIKKISFFLLGNSNLVILLNYLVAPLITITTCIIFAILLKKLIPSFYKFLTGSR